MIYNGEVSNVFLSCAVCPCIPPTKLMIYTHTHHNNHFRLYHTILLQNILVYRTNTVLVFLNLFNAKSMYTIMYVHDERQPDICLKC